MQSTTHRERCGRLLKLPDRLLGLLLPLKLLPRLCATNDAAAGTGLRRARPSPWALGLMRPRLGPLWARLHGAEGKPKLQHSNSASAARPQCWPPKARRKTVDGPH